MWPAIIGAASTIGSALLSGYSAKSVSENQESINRQQTGLTREQMQWQESMSNTAHVREVADLKKAGLNPILSANHGASTGSPVGLPRLGNPAEVGVGAMRSAMSSAKEYAGVALTNAMAKTEVTKQIKNLADAGKAKGGVKIPFLADIPFTSARDAWRATFNKLKSGYNASGGKGTQHKFIQNFIPNKGW